MRQRTSIRNLSMPILFRMPAPGATLSSVTIIQIEVTIKDDSNQSMSPQVILIHPQAPQ